MLACAPSCSLPPRRRITLRLSASPWRLLYHGLLGFLLGKEEYWESNVWYRVTSNQITSQVSGMVVNGMWIKYGLQKILNVAIEQIKNVHLLRVTRLVHGRQRGSLSRKGWLAVLVLVILVRIHWVNPTTLFCSYQIGMSTGAEHPASGKRSRAAGGDGRPHGPHYLQGVRSLTTPTSWLSAMAHARSLGYGSTRSDCRGA